MRYMLILLGLIVANVANAMDCQTPPDCASLGYSTEPDPNCAQNGYILCPFNEAYKRCVIKDCEKLGFTEDDKTSWCKNIASCRGNEKYTLCVKATCEIGDVFYADGSCGLAEDYDPNNKTKIPVGVVYYVTDGGYHGRVLNLYPLTADKNGNFDPAHPYDGSKEELWWGLFETDVSDLRNYYMFFTDDFDQAKEETQIAAKASSTKTECLNRTYQEHSEEYNKYCQATAAKATLAFYPPDVSPENNIVGQGRWFMPTFADLFYMQGFNADEVQSGYNNSGVIGDVRQKLNETFSYLKDKGVKVEGFSDCGTGQRAFWQCITEENAKNVLSMRMNDGLKNDHHKATSMATRAILAFQKIPSFEGAFVRQFSR